MNLITSLDDGLMKRLKTYRDGGGIGFVGYEMVLYLSLVAAFERIEELQGVPTGELTHDEESGYDPDPDVGSR